MSRSGDFFTIDRRRFVQGLAGLGASTAIGLRSAPALAVTGPAEPSSLRGNRFKLSLDRITVNKTGSPSWANAINGGVPGPTLHWKEGDVVTLDVTNNLPVATGVHWHGIILPNPMDGVPGLEFLASSPARPSPTVSRSSRAAPTGTTATWATRSRRAPMAR